MFPTRRTQGASTRHGAGVAPRIEPRIELKTLRFQCPNTRREVDSGVSTHPTARLISILVRCQICEGLHELQVADGSLRTVPSVLQEPQRPSKEIVELREELLDEMNHRLKNNLQILYGLLQAAYYKTENEEALEILSDTSRRIGAMGTAQQIFYSVHNSTDVRSEIFLEAVCANARDFLSNDDVSIKYEVTTGYLPKETTVPLALVLNELLTNAAKHGGNDRGRVTIDMGLRQRSGEIELYVQDRGSGFNFEEVQGRSSGLGLVTKLAQRLHGTFTVERRSGARCTLRIPDQ
jgi:two-component sensor histidine kinase